MNVHVMVVTDEEFHWPDATVTFDTAVLQVIAGVETTTFPLSSVVYFSTSETVTP